MLSVVYRTGGTERFRWGMSVAVFTRAEAIALIDDLSKLGYRRAFIVTADEAHRVGVPVTFEAAEYREQLRE